ncbi:MAG: hypothetical protein M3299_12420, partial [Thermoproteota archaeon]|nr:hypothetical protein [Thermoproteota archaeon]
SIDKGPIKMSEKLSKYCISPWTLEGMTKCNFVKNRNAMLSLNKGGLSPGAVKNLCEFYHLF